MKPIEYKGYWLYPTYTGFWEVWFDGSFVLFDSLEHAKSSIDYWTK